MVLIYKDPVNDILFITKFRSSNNCVFQLDNAALQSALTITPLDEPTAAAEQIFYEEMKRRSKLFYNYTYAISEIVHKVI